MKTKWSLEEDIVVSGISGRFPGEITNRLYDIIDNHDDFVDKFNRIR